MQVVEKYKDAQIPLETFVTDLQYMDKNQDFTTSDSYPLDQFKAFVQMLHTGNQRWVRAPVMRSTRISDQHDDYFQLLLHMYMRIAF